MKPLYIWAGGKNKMIPKYVENPGIPLSGFDTYIEPFFGGGAMMLWIAERCPDIKRYVMNDVKEELVGIYKAIKNDLEDFIHCMDLLSVQYLPLDKESRKSFYYELRDEYATGLDRWSPTQDSATLYFLMKTAFNGIWQSKKTSNGRFATPSGLLNQKTAVYDKTSVLEWNKFLQKVDILCGDWKDATAYADGKSFFFMDPPYRHSFTSYGEEFTDEHLVELIEFSIDRDVKGDHVMVCNREEDVDDFFDLHKGHLSSLTYDITYTAGRRRLTDEGHEAKAAKEILIYSPRQRPESSIYTFEKYFETK